MKGTVIETTGSWHEVLLDDGKSVKTRLKGKLRLEDIKLTNPVAVGDRVVLDNAEEDHSIVITEIEERKNKIIRQSPRKKRHYHIIAANIDQAFIVASMKMPRTKKGFISRVLIALEYYEIPTTIIFNKSDLYQEKDWKGLEELRNTLDKIGYSSLVCSNKTGEGIDQVTKAMRGQLNVVTGPSGVGKSTLLNQINPELELRTKEVSNYSEKGQHTTTFSRMHPMPDGGFIIDTPGIKEYGLAKIDAYELSFYFPEMKTLTQDCKFNNCQHVNEPKCAIRKAFEAGEISEWRYNNYLLIREELLIENKHYL